MRNQNKRIHLLISTLIILSCTKDKSIQLPQSYKYPSLPCNKKINQIDTVRNLIVGTYDWVYTNVYTRGVAPRKETPNTSGYTERYIFYNDSTFQCYRNGKLEFTKKYVIDYENRVTHYSPDSTTIAYVYDKKTRQYYMYFRTYLCNDSALFLISRSEDYFGYYVRH